MSVRVLCGDARTMLATLPDASVQCCVTSPPYYGLRDYGTGSWSGGDPACDHQYDTSHQRQGATSARAGRSNIETQRNENFRDACPKCGAIRVDQQIGLERSPDAYVAELIAVFREMRRVLRDDGTLWLNLGDSYASGGRDIYRSGASDNKGHLIQNELSRPIDPPGIKSKDLLGMPWMVAFALRADGWYLRSDIIWHKPNPMPESVTDRPTSAHEHVFLLAKQERYFFDAEAVREDRTKDEDAATFRGGCYVNGNTDNGLLGKRQVVGNRRIKVPGGWDRGPGAHGTIHRDGRTSAEYQEAEVRAGRNIRNVWTIATSPYPEAHFATFPPELAERCIKAGTSERGACPHCAAPWVRSVERIDQGWDGSRYGERVVAATGGAKTGGTARSTLGSGNGKLTGKSTTTGWQPSCDCAAAEPVPCVVLDPFGGAGTTALVADRLGRDAVLIELNPAYCALAERRIVGDAPLFAQVAAQ